MSAITNFFTSLFSANNTLWLFTWLILLAVSVVYLLQKNRVDRYAAHIGRLVTKLWPLIVCTYFILILISSEQIATKSGENVSPVLQWSILILSSFLSFVAFYVQYRFNRTQKEDIERERFENNFFHYLELINSQQDACEIPGVGKSKQVFHFMFYEYKAILYLVNKSQAFNDCPKTITPLELYHSYRLFINGVSTSSIDRLCSNSDLVIVEKIKKLNDLFIESRSSKKSPKYLADYDASKIVLFDGHRLRLVPYFRTLIMIVQYLQKSKDNGCITGDDAEFYYKVFLSQLSEHQISLMYIMYLCDCSSRLSNTSNFEHESFMIGDMSASVIDFFEKTLPRYIQADVMNPLSARFISF